MSVFIVLGIYNFDTAVEQRQWRHFSKSSLISQPSSVVPPALEALCIVTYEGAAAYSAPALQQCRAGGTEVPRTARTAQKGGNGKLRGKRPLYNHSNTRTLKLASLGVITLFVVGPQLFEVVSYTLLLSQSQSLQHMTDLFNQLFFFQHLSQVSRHYASLVKGWSITIDFSSVATHLTLFKPGVVM